VADQGDLYRPNQVDLTGLSGRLWVALLLRTMRNRPKQQQLAILDQVLSVHEDNLRRSGSRANEKLALLVEKSGIDRISREAIIRRQPDVVDEAALPACARLLETAGTYAWNRGVSPTTRIELDIEMAKVLYLQDNTEGALKLLDENLRTAVSFGYKCYEYDILILKAEIAWFGGREEDAEVMFERLYELENETKYKSAHGLIMMIRMNSRPTRTMPG
jgi:hypothetical protein